MIDARYYRAMLVYGNGVKLHTAVSGAIDGLSERYLRIQCGSSVGIGAIRANIAYLSGVSEAELDAQIVSACRWLGSFDASEPARRALDIDFPFSNPVKALVELALLDLEARRAGLSLGRYLRQSHVLDSLLPMAEAPILASNQTLFHGMPDAVVAQARGYAERGFGELKLRVGFGDIDSDLALLARVREAVGADIDLAIDVNGRWSLEQTLSALPRLHEVDLAYLEQPLTKGEWTRLARLCEHTELPILLDEGLSSDDDMQRLSQLPRQVGAHLKLVKVGGFGALSELYSQLHFENRPRMIGQMNEGGLATSFTVHAAWALGETRGELYGADGIADDPFPLVDYANGFASVEDRSTDTVFRRLDALAIDSSILNEVSQ
ncbi:mandelate racemase/muconate lactonizing enzyme family protein [Kushneria aurantia]|uniref:Mandelate racemase/muconate lactonizing enzyme family protein n=1 Tax=Kushneria aurantia TaxID=504092 RepID=A0ABV6G1L0_9GAMM|nr:enolase C-terminal domain-like protein [Kushneria aurantia]